MKLPKIDLKELKRLKKQNFQERLHFIDMYAEWVKTHKNKKWSSQQNELID